MQDIKYTKPIVPVSNGKTASQSLKIDNVVTASFIQLFNATL